MSTNTETVESSTPPAVKTRGIPAWAMALSFVALIAFLAFIGLGLKRSQQGPVTVGQMVPPITLNTFDGDVIHTADLKGKVVVLNFWASWCKPCESEAAELEEAWRRYQPDGSVVFLGVDYVDTEPEARAYLERFDITYPNGPDLRTKISQTFRIRGVPETYILDREGKLAAVKIGPFESLQEIYDTVDPVVNRP